MMITLAPQPSIKELYAGLSNSVSSDLKADSPWHSENSTTFWFSRSAWALLAIVRWWCAINNKTSPVIWLPNYFCNEPISPLRSTDSEIAFYPIKDDLNPDWPICRDMAEEKPPDIFILVHYFGRTSDGSVAKLFCKDVNAHLVEDAAHVFTPTVDIGHHGDFTIFSPYKFLAIPHGGLLVVNNHKYVEAIGRSVAQFNHSTPNTFGWIAKQALKKILPAFAVRIISKQGSLSYFEDPVLRALAQTPRLGTYALRMIHSAVPAFDDIAQRRKQNARALRILFDPQPDCAPLFTDQEEGEAPYRFVLKFNQPNDANNMFAKLTAAGCPVESWPDLPPEVLKNAGENEIAVRLRKTLIFIQIHQSIDIDQLLLTCIHD